MYCILHECMLGSTYHACLRAWCLRLPLLFLLLVSLSILGHLLGFFALPHLALPVHHLHPARDHMGEGHGRGRS